MERENGPRLWSGYVGYVHPTRLGRAATKLGSAIAAVMGPLDPYGHTGWYRLSNGLHDLYMGMEYGSPDREWVMQHLLWFHQRFPLFVWTEGPYEMRAEP